MKRQWYYRGSLKSCNYGCSYCPFSKRKMSESGWQKDKEALFRFIRRMNSCIEAAGAVQIIPYGEALIHEYYWEGLAALSRNPRLDAAGAQSNFSFPAAKMLDIYCGHGGSVEKLRLWGTFHPEMTSLDEFLAQCSRLDARNVIYCVGAVGVPEHLDIIRRLRKALPAFVYLWINKMDGMKGQYTESEKKAFMEIDPYFELELARHRADIALCRDNRFVEADGTMHRCNLCRQVIGNFYTDPVEGIPEGRMDGKKGADHPDKKEAVCTRKECSCYLSYCGRQEEQLLFFQPYPAFRIPAYKKAVFLDIDGTLLPAGQRQIPEPYIRRLRHLSRYSDLYFATSLPPEAARRKAGQLWHVMRGGVFAGGARCMIFEEAGFSGMDEIQQLETDFVPHLKEYAWKYGYKVYVYKKGGSIYKVTLAAKNKRKRPDLTAENPGQIKQVFGIPDSCQVIPEENCMQIIRKGAGKLQGVLRICETMGYEIEDIAVFGNSSNDMEMLAGIPFSVAARGSSEAVRKSAGYAFL